MWLLIVAMMLAALNLRTAVTSVGSLLEEVRTGLGLSGALTGVVTTIPVVCFAAMGAVAPWLSRKIGDHRTVAAALTAMTIGLAARAFAGSAVTFLLLSVVALAGGAVGNVLLPSLVKRHFPNHVGSMTAAYTTALAIGITMGAGLSVPIAESGNGGNWRLGLGIWAILGAIAVIPWLGLLGDRGGAGGAAHLRVGPRQLIRSPLALCMVVFFGSQSAVAYIGFGWFAQFFRDNGISAQNAGFLVAFLAALSIPVSAVVPAVMSRMRSQRSIIVAVTILYVVGFTGMLAAPTTATWLWVLIVGLGYAAFPVALTLIALRTRTAPATAALSAFTQSIGYVIAGAGPLLVGVLHGASGTWGSSFALIFVLVTVLAVSGWYAAGDRYLEDQITSKAAS